jgi:hypothetical protein
MTAMTRHVFLFPAQIIGGVGVYTVWIDNSAEKYIVVYATRATE